MLIKAAIMISGVAVASAVAAFPPFAPAERPLSQHAASPPQVDAAPLARKGDRLHILAAPCTNAAEMALCADIYGAVAAPRPTLTVERRIGDSTSVLIRVPVPQLASR